MYLILYAFRAVVLCICLYYYYYYQLPHSNTMYTPTPNFSRVLLTSQFYSRFYLGMVTFQVSQRKYSVHFYVAHADNMTCTSYSPRLGHLIYTLAMSVSITLPRWSSKIRHQIASGIPRLNTEVPPKTTR